MAATRAYGVLATRLGALGGDPADPVQALVGLEALGVPEVWLPHLFGLDPLPVIAAAAVRTTALRFGTAVAPTWPRHPVLLMQEAFAVQAVSAGRLTLGVGLSDVPTIRDALGLDWREPIAHLDEYLAVCAQARSGRVSFHGRRYRVEAELTGVPAQRLPLVASGLNPRAIDTAARRADGLVTLLAPPGYLAGTVGPRIAARQREDGFRLIACVPMAVTDHVDAARAAAEDIYGGFRRYTGYDRMLRAAGNPAIAEIAVIGPEPMATEALEPYFAAGVDTFVAAPFPVPTDPDAMPRTLRLIAALGRT